MGAVDVTVRVGSAADVVGVARLRWLRATQDHGYGGDEFDEFVEALREWMRGHPEHRVFVALAGEAVVGMAWVMGA